MVTRRAFYGLVLLALVPLAIAQQSALAPRVLSFRQQAAAAGCSTLKDSATGTVEEAASVGNVAGNTYVATKFTAGSSYTACKAELLIGRAGATGTPTGNIFAYMYSDSSGPNTLLATSDAVDVSAIPAGSNYVAFTFSSAASLTSGSTYWVALSHTNTDFLSFVYWWRNSGFVAGGVYSSTNGTVWSALSSRRNNFKTFSN